MNERYSEFVNHAKIALKIDIIILYYQCTELINKFNHNSNDLCLTFLSDLLDGIKIRKEKQSLINAIAEAQKINQLATNKEFLDCYAHLRVDKLKDLKRAIQYLLKILTNMRKINVIEKFGDALKRHADMFEGRDSEQRKEILKLNEILLQGVKLVSPSETKKILTLEKFGVAILERYKVYAA